MCNLPFSCITRMGAFETNVKGYTITHWVHIISILFNCSVDQMHRDVESHTNASELFPCFRGIHYDINRTILTCYLR